jgi:hypothetical protein
LKPLVLVFAGLFFAIIIIALMLPVYDLVSEISMRRGAGRLCRFFGLVAYSQNTVVRILTFH